MPGKKWSLFENGTPGLHLIINPQKPLEPEAMISRQFVNRSLRLSSDELRALMASRTAGIATLNGMMADLLPGFGADTRLKFSTKIADALMEKSLAAQLSREAPTTLDNLQQRDDALRHILQQSPPPGATRAPAPTLVDQIPVGVSVTVHF